MQVIQGKGKAMKVECYKSNSIIGNPSSKITLQDERYINICLGRVFKKDLLDKDVFYKIDVAYYAEKTGVSLHQSYTDLREIAASLRHAKVIIPQGKSEMLEVGWVSSILYNDKDYTLSVQWNEHVIPFISGFKYGKYTVLHESVVKISSLNAFRLYEILKRDSYKGTFTLDYMELQTMLGVSYGLFGDFKAKLIVPCIAEIENKTDMRVKVQYNKTARKVTSLTFDIRFNAAMRFGK